MTKWIAGAVAIFIGLWAVTAYNGLVSKDEAVNQAWGQVQNVMQRQADLIPNLVNTVQASAKFEKGTLTAVTEARAKLTAVSKMDPKDLANNPDLQKQLILAQQQTGSLINLVKEAYPDLKSVALFSQLTAQLEGAQNRITVERRSVQRVTETFNVSVRQFPGSFVASYGGFKPKIYYVADDAAQHAPVVKFD